MPDASPEELSQEIEKLWAKVAAAPSSGEPVGRSLEAPAAEPSAADGAAWEAVSMIERRHKADAREWAELLETKERALQSFRERLASLETELSQLRGQARAGGEAVIRETFEARQKLEAAAADMELERARHEEERKALQELLDAARQKMAAEAAARESERRQWEKKEKQFLLELRELEARGRRDRQEASQSAVLARRLGETAKEAKGALERTLAELLRQGRAREEAEKEKERSLERLKEVEGHFAELSKMWEEERSQWQELWQRERSAWESQKAEFSAWEEKLRREREARQAELAEKEKAQARFAEAMTQSLRQSAEASSTLSTVIAQIAETARKLGRRFFTIF